MSSVNNFKYCCSNETKVSYNINIINTVRNDSRVEGIYWKIFMVYTRN